MSRRFAIVTLAVVLACFGAGIVLGRKSGTSPTSSGGSARAGASSANAPVSALRSGKGGHGTHAAQTLSKLSRSGEHGLFAKFRGYMQLVGKAELGEAGKQQLHQLALTLLDLADRIPPKIDWVLRVDGHTDRTPSGLPAFLRTGNCRRRVLSPSSNISLTSACRQPGSWPLGSLTTILSIHAGTK